MGCTQSNTRGVLKGASINDSIHTMKKRGKRDAKLQGLPILIGYQSGSPHPLMQPKSSSVVTSTEDESITLAAEDPIYDTSTNNG